MDQARARAMSYPGNRRCRCPLEILIVNGLHNSARLFRGTTTMGYFTH